MSGALLRAGIYPSFREEVVVRHAEQFNLTWSASLLHGWRQITGGLEVCVILNMKAARQTSASGLPSHPLAAEVLDYRLHFSAPPPWLGFRETPPHSNAGLFV